MVHLHPNIFPNHQKPLTRFNRYTYFTYSYYTGGDSFGKFGVGRGEDDKKDDMMYYIQTHGNGGYIYLLLPGKTEWSSWSIEYAIDAHLEVKESEAKEIVVSDLPESITQDFDFQRNIESVKAIYALT